MGLSIPFQRVIPDIAEAHQYAVEAGKSKLAIEALAAAQNLAIRFSFEGESRVPGHEALAVALLMETAIEAGVKLPSFVRASEYMRGVVDACFVPKKAMSVEGLGYGIAR